jgi:hypothetical protein
MAMANRVYLVKHYEGELIGKYRYASQEEADKAISDEIARTKRGIKEYEDAGLQVPPQYYLWTYSTETI